jgi:transcriptional regulator of NAD metabolism
MRDHPVFLGSLPLRRPRGEVEGDFVSVRGEPFYRIANYDRMDPFFISVVSASDHWLFISSNGGLTAGRRNADFALFPYYAEDRIHDDAGRTGGRTALRLVDGGDRRLWEPLAPHGLGVYQTSRNLYKHIYGTSLVFEEINHDLGLVFRTRWSACDRFGFEKRSELRNEGETAVTVEVLDGIENLLPWGLHEAFQSRFSVLGNAYKQNELDPATGLATYALSSIPGDSTEPAEALRANVCWSTLGDAASLLLSSAQLDRFRRGGEVESERRVLGRRGAFFVRHDVVLAAGEEREWSIVADLGYGASDVARLQALLADGDRRRVELRDDLDASTEALARIVAGADGLQSTRDRLSSVHHFANVLFNVMRGGTFESGYTIDTADLADFVASFNREVSARHGEALRALGGSVELGALRAETASWEDPDLLRLVTEYLPISFSRRHGDPSRPWNRFSIELRDTDGSRILAYEGNWRDIFQNWEALSLSFPEFLDAMVGKFVNTTTADGYNPYRITRDGYDWETPAPDEPWANLGYWGDHQIAYLTKLLEGSRAHHPARLESLLREARFVYADVPYDLRPYRDLLADPRHAIDYDGERQVAIERRVSKLGFDGRYLPGPRGGPLRANLTEKLLVPLLAKLCSFVPEAGIWMNTQRPEWNDANNALAGFGASMVTVGYARRYITFCLDLFAALADDEVELNAEVADWFARTHAVFAEHEALIAETCISNIDRKTMLDGLGTAAGDYRARLYEDGLSGRRKGVAPVAVRDLLQRALRFLDHSIAANRREDGLYEAYNVLQISDEAIGIRRLYAMLEGQVAVLSSGALGPAQACEVLAALRASPIYREDQHSYMLYPDRTLATFFDKNTISAEQVERSALLGRLLAEEDVRLVERDVSGAVHFNADFRNERDVERVLDELRSEGLEALVDRDAEVIAEIFESIFDHERFTGRSGTFYGYEGLGSIYWHMVGKLLLAVQESALKAAATNDTELFRELAERYYDVRAGLGFNKPPQVFGAFPTDPYSHTPAHAGAKQPGMTGQVKEEVLTRLGELGLRVSEGCIRFEPVLLRRSEFFEAPESFRYFDVRGEAVGLRLEAESLVFTYCQVPIIYRLSETAAIELTLHDGTTRTIEGSSLEASDSSELFRRSGRIRRIDVFLMPGLEG